MIDHNQLDEISNVDWSKLNKLHSFSVTSNPIKILPPKIFYLPLYQLNISHTQIEELPTEYYNQSSIVALILNNNKIVSFNSCVCNLPLLSSLYLESNQIESLDENLQIDCKNLKIISFNRNFFFFFFFFYSFFFFFKTTS